jgi:hypothetical protein
MKTKEDFLKQGESLEKFDTSGWIVPERQLPINSDIILDWPSTWPNDEYKGPFRCTVVGHYFNGVIRVTRPDIWPEDIIKWPTINLGSDTWHSIWKVVGAS